MPEWVRGDEVAMVGVLALVPSQVGKRKLRQECKMPGQKKFEVTVGAERGRCYLY